MMSFSRSLLGLSVYVHLKRRRRGRSMGPGHRSSEAFVFGEVKRSERRDEKGYRQTVKRQQHDAVECNDSVRVQKKHSTRSSSFWHAVRRIAALSVVVVVADDGLYGNGSQLREESSTERQSPEQQLHSLCLLHSLLSLSLTPIFCFSHHSPLRYLTAAAMQST